MSASIKHNGWLAKAEHGILAAVKRSAKDGATVTVTNTAVDGVLVGTPVTPALAVDSLVISNQVTSGDVLIAAASSSGNSQAYIWIDGSAGTLNLYGAGTSNLVLSATAVEVEDNILLALGNDQDQVAINRASSLNADTALTGVVVGTPVVAAIPANSLILSNTTADGDQVFMGQTGGNSQEWMRYDASAKLVVFNEDSGDVDFRIESNGNANMFVVDGGSDVIGIGGAVVANQTVTITNAALNATAGRVLKLSGTVAAPNHSDGYGAFEVDITASGTIAGTTAASSTWLNFAGSSVPGGNMICCQNNGIYLPAGITASSAKMIMGARMQYVADDGANPGSLFCFSTNIYSNVLTAIFDVNAIGDLGGSTGAQTGNDYKIPLLKDESAGVVWYVNVYHT